MRNQKRPHDDFVLSDTLIAQQQNMLLHLKVKPNGAHQDSLNLIAVTETISLVRNNHISQRKPKAQAVAKNYVLKIHVHMRDERQVLRIIDWLMNFDFVASFFTAKCSRAEN